MHYRNGRPAQNGDRVVLTVPGQAPVAGILYGATPGNDMCNGRIATTTPSDAYPDLRNVLHADDIASPSAVIPDVTAPPTPLPAAAAQDAPATAGADQAQAAS